jgi:hypothetical protein
LLVALAGRILWKGPAAERMRSPDQRRLLTIHPRITRTPRIAGWYWACAPAARALAVMHCERADRETIHLDHTTVGYCKNFAAEFGAA